MMIYGYWKVKVKIYSIEKNEHFDKFSFPSYLVSLFKKWKLKLESKVKIVDDLKRYH